MYESLVSCSKKASVKGQGTQCDLALMSHSPLAAFKQCTQNSRILISP